MIFWTHGKGGPQASNFGEMVRGDHRHEIFSHMVRGDHRHQILVTW